jgi:hypothetical protein
MTTIVTADIEKFRYDVTAERIVWGTIGSKGHVMDGILYFPLRTADGVVDIQVGPVEFVKDCRFDLKVGEIVSVIGVPAMMAEQEILIAREIQSMTAILVLRDRNGDPIWNPRPPIQMDPEKPSRGDSSLCLGTN